MLGLLWSCPGGTTRRWHPSPPLFTPAHNRAKMLATEIIHPCTNKSLPWPLRWILSLFFVLLIMLCVNTSLRFNRCRDLCCRTKPKGSICSLVKLSRYCLLAFQTGIEQYNSLSVLSEFLSIWHNFMKMVVENWLLCTFNECEQLQHDCYLQLGLLKIMIGYFLVRFNFILICLWVSY